MPDFTVTQIGSREHYAIPRALEAVGRLAQLYTDAWAPAGRAILTCGPTRARALASRFHRDIPNIKITSFTASTLWREMTLRKAQTTEETFLRHVRIGRDFCACVNRTLSRHLGPGDVFFGYDTGCLETLPLARGLGAVSIVDQVDAGRVEQEIVLEECARFPDWQAVPGRIPDAYFERLSQEWAMADRVVVNSSWSQSALVRQGVPAEKIAVVPLVYEPPASLPPRRPKKPGEPLLVLFLGQVILCKGVQYLFEAARRLQGENITFTLAGPLGISEKALATMPPNMRHIGRVTRERLTATYLAHHVFVLPTLSDGFALTQLEAMAHGLPVITTPRCGNVVTPGDDGSVVPPRDVDALAATLADYAADPEKWAAHSHRARRTSGGFRLRNLSPRLLALASPPSSQ